MEHEALLLQRDCARHLSVEILQLQNISPENPIVRHYLRDSTFSRLSQSSWTLDFDLALCEECASLGVRVVAVIQLTDMQQWA